MKRDPFGRGLLSGRTSYPVERYLDRLLGRLTLRNGKGKALDAGCGDGLVSAWLEAQGWTVTGEDQEAHPAWPSLKAQAKKLRFSVRDAGKPGPGAYDLVLAKDMLHHAHDPVMALKRLAARVRPGGRLLIIECNRLNPIFYVHLTLLKGHEHFTLGRLKNLMLQAGLKGSQLQRQESRVFPWGGPRVHNLFDRAQDLAEALPVWAPFVCYHALSWRKPGSRR